MGSQFHHRPRFQGPSLNPVQSDFPSTVCSHGISPTAFCRVGELKCLLTSTLRLLICCQLDIICSLLLCPGSVSRSSVPYNARHVPSAPLPSDRCYLRKSSLCYFSRSYPTFIALTSTCVRPRILLAPLLLAIEPSPCRLSQIPAE